MLYQEWKEEHWLPKQRNALSRLLLAPALLLLALVAFDLILEDFKFRSFPRNLFAPALPNSCLRAAAAAGFTHVLIRLLHRAL
eukprot:4870944-Pleurochrysis_carterae.AAC.1